MIKGINIAGIVSKLQQHMSAVFWVVLVIQLVLEGFILQNSIRMIVQTRSVAAPVADSRTVRINFQGYDQAMTRIEQNSKFKASPTDLSDPFSVEIEQ